MNKWHIPTQDKQNEISTIVDFLNQYGNFIAIVSIVLLISYFYFRNKINIRYLLDVFIVSLSLLVLYIVLAPHRFQGFAYFMSMSFR